MNAILAAIAYCVAGSNAGAPGGEALHVLECDAETGAAKIVQAVPGTEGATYFAFSRDGRRLYAAVSEKRGGANASALVAFPFSDGRLGAMERLAALPCEAPCHVALSPCGRYVSFAAYSSGVFGRFALDGGGLKSAVLPEGRTGPNRPRQKKPYAHQTFFTDPGCGVPYMMGVADLGCDRILFFDPETLAPAKCPALRTAPGDGPRHAMFMPGSGCRTLWVVNELGSSVSTYRFDGAAFSPAGSVSTLPPGFDRFEPDGEHLATKASAIKYDPAGGFVMASNRGFDSIAFFRHDSAGRLSPAGISKLSGSFPRDFEPMPGGKFFVVGHKMSNEIQVYSFDREAPSLKPVGDPIACWRPLCFKFAPANLPAARGVE